MRVAHQANRNRLHHYTPFLLDCQRNVLRSQGLLHSRLTGRLIPLTVDRAGTSASTSRLWTVVHLEPETGTWPSCLSESD